MPNVQQNTVTDPSLAAVRFGASEVLTRMRTERGKAPKLTSDEVLDRLRKAIVKPGMAARVDVHNGRPYAFFGNDQWIELREI